MRKGMTPMLEWVFYVYEIEREHYLHTLVYMKCVAQIM